MKNAKKLILICVTLVMLLAVGVILAASATTEPTEGIIYQGTCGANGDNLKWSFNTATGDLIISGEGSMKDYSAYTAPWSDYCSSVLTARVENGVTDIGD